jgi:hypothetical protein
MTFSGYFYNSVTNICFHNEAEIWQELSLNKNNHIQQNDTEEDKNAPQKDCNIRLLFSLYFMFDGALKQTEL